MGENRTIFSSSIKSVYSFSLTINELYAIYENHIADNIILNLS